MGGDRAAPRTATLVAAGVQAAAVVAVVGVGVVPEGLQLDPWRPVATTVLYLVPAVLAVLALRARPSLLLAAAATSVALALAGFSVHSFVFLPVAIVYVVAYSRGEQRPGRARLVPVLLCPLLGVAALAVLFLHEDPACYARQASGDVAIDRSPGDVMTGSLSIAAGSDVVERGCTSDTVVGWEAAGSVALSGLAVVTGLGLAPPVPSGHDTTPSSAHW